MPVWGRSGQELYYASTSDTRLMAVPINEGQTFVYGEPFELFTIQGRDVVSGGNESFYDVMPGDEQFVMILNDEVTGRLVFVENFFQELTQRAGN